jgi:LysM repeat protein
VGLLKRLSLAVGYACILTIAWLWCFGPGPWNFDAEMFHRARYAVAIADNWLAVSFGASVAPTSEDEVATPDVGSEVRASETMTALPDSATESTLDQVPSPTATAAAPVALTAQATATSYASVSFATMPATATVTATPTTAPSRPTGTSTQIPATPTATVALPGPDGAYIVQAGDTLDAIAARYGTTVDAILAASGLTRQQFIWLGQKLVIPGDWQRVARSSASTGGDALMSAPAGAETDRGVTSGAAGTPRPGAGAGIASTATLTVSLAYRDALVIYTVQPGDYLAAIARKYGTSVESIAATNHITNPGRIIVGMTLTIPTVEFTPMPAPGGSRSR